MKTHAQTLRDFEKHIIENQYDDEEAHFTEDEAMRYFIKNVLHLTHEEIIEAQEIFKRISEMDFSRWCA
jgi:DNA-binding MltR family transcriptional regulator